MSKRTDLVSANKALRLINSDYRKYGDEIICCKDYCRSGLTYNMKLRDVYRHKYSKFYHTTISSLNRYGIVKDGSVYYINYPTCYGWLNTNKKFFTGTDLIFSANHIILQDPILKKQQRALFNWFINESPWSNVILTKSTTFALKYGIVVNANMPANITISALMAWRNIRLFYNVVYTSDNKFETSHILSSWYDLIKCGVNKNLAFIIKTLIKGNFNNLNPTSFRGGDVITIQIFTKKNIIRFLNGEVANTTDTFKNLGYYGSIPPFKNNTTIINTFHNYYDSINRSLECVKYFDELLKYCNYPSTIDNYVDLIAEWCKKEFPEHH